MFLTMEHQRVMFSGIKTAFWRMSVSKVDFIKRFDLDLLLKDSSTNSTLSVEQRVLAALAIGTEAIDCLNQTDELLDVLRGVQRNVEHRFQLAELLEDRGKVFLRSIYFAQAGRGIGLAVKNLEWLRFLLHQRVVTLEKCRAGGRSYSISYLRYRCWGGRMELVVDRNRVGCGASLCAVPRQDVPLTAYDVGLIGMSVDLRVSPLLRAIAGLSVGMGIDDLYYALGGILDAFDEVRTIGPNGGEMVSDILSGSFDDFQRAVFFACCGRSWDDCYRSVAAVREEAERRAHLYRSNREQGIDGGMRVSPYVRPGAPEACLFVPTFR